MRRAPRALRPDGFDGLRLGIRRLRLGIRKLRPEMDADRVTGVGGFPPSPCPRKLVSNN
ncbi:hypothetical protein GCM10023335_62790 [Streptomyces siamensis]|uniref:Uncharacterized protein n=1 Tax=Streptomyces siamensis TaxID=1274986 RepID=A0ABP9JD64_9ACTN